MKKSKKRTLITILSLLVFALIVITVSTVCVKNYYKPENALKRMFSLRADMKLEEYYNCFDIPEESKCYMNSLDAYLLMAEEKNWTKIDSFEITQKRTNSFEIKYGEITENLELTKSDNKSAFGFDAYKIKIESVTSPLFYVATLIDADVLIDGNPIKDLKLNEADIENAYFLTGNDTTNDIFGASLVGRNTPINYFQIFDERYDNYCFANVFDRDYKINITTDYTYPFEAFASPSEDPYIFRELQLTDETELEIKNVGESFIPKYYYAMQNGDDFESISTLITSDEEQVEYFRNDYADLINLFTRGELTDGIIDICFLNSTTTVSYPSEYASNQKEFKAITTLDYSYNAISYDGITDEYTYHYDCFDSTTFTISCVNENGKWVVYSIEDTLINFIR